MTDPKEDNDNKVAVPRWAIRFILDHAEFHDEGPMDEGWPSMKMRRALDELEKATVGPKL